ncbi:hypothetical protein BDV11DRAFT_178664 [Aspergillus similis]
MFVSRTCCGGRLILGTTTMLTLSIRESIQIGKPMDSTVTFEAGPRRLPLTTPLLLNPKHVPTPYRVLSIPAYMVCTGHISAQPQVQIESIGIRCPFPFSSLYSAHSTYGSRYVLSAGSPGPQSSPYLPYTHAHMVQPTPKPTAPTGRSFNGNYTH